MINHACTSLAHSPFDLIGSQDANGNADVIPKGDKPGFAAVLYDTTIAIPDRPRNNRLDTFENLIENPAIGLILPYAIALPLTANCRSAF